MSKIDETAKMIASSLLEKSKGDSPWASYGQSLPDAPVAQSSCDVRLSPLTNRGVENTKPCIEFKIDYLSVTIHHKYDEVFTNLIPFLMTGSAMSEVHWGDLFHNVGHGGRGYKSLWVSPIGVTLYAHPINKDQDHCHIEIKGSALESIGQGRLLDFIRKMDATYEKWNATRLDGAYDHSDISPYMMHEASSNNELRTHCRYRKMEVSTVGEKDSATHYIGNRKSGSMRILRVYDMRGYNRVELELRKERADMVINDLLYHSNELWPKRFMEHLRDFVDVIDVDTGSGNRSRSELAPWWASFVLDASKAGMRLETEDKSLERSKKWFEKSVATTLGMLLESGYVDDEWLFQSISIGSRKMTPRQRLLSSTHRLSSDKETDKKEENIQIHHLNHLYQCQHNASI
jgi:hypothetical protein